MSLILLFHQKLTEQYNLRVVTLRTKEASSRRSGRVQNTLSRSVSLGDIRGGNLAWKRLLDFHSYSVDTSSLAMLKSNLNPCFPRKNRILSCFRFLYIQNLLSFFLLCMIKFAAIKTLIILRLVESL